MSKAVNQSILTLIIILLSANAAAEWQVRSVKIAGIEDYSAQNCVQVETGQQVDYRFKSPYPLDFKVYYRTDVTTGFEVKKKQITELSGEFSSAAEQQYCFIWINRKAFGNEWDLTLNYRVSAE